MIAAWSYKRLNQVSCVTEVVSTERLYVWCYYIYATENLVCFRVRPSASESVSVNMLSGNL